MDFIENFLQPLGNGLYNLLIALLILIVGYILARLIAAIIRRLLQRTSLDNRLADMLSEPDQPRKFEVEDVIARVIFWILMLFVLVAFFSRLNLEALSAPIEAFLEDFTVEYLPRVAGAAIILILAWLIATVLKLLIRKGASLLKLDERLSKQAELEDEERVSFSESLANGVFWFVLLLALPTALRALGILELSEPLQNVLNTILGYIPNILAALVIFGLGWFIARVVRQIVANLLKSIGADGLGERIGLAEERSLSMLVGNILYIIILLVTIIAALGQLDIDAISGPTTEMLSTIINAIPNLIGAALVLVIAYFVAKLVADLVRDLLSSIGFDSVPERLGLKWSPTTTPSQWLGYLVLVAIMLLATVSALELLGSEALTVMLNAFIAFFWKVLLAAVILAIGLYMANLAYKAVDSTGINQSNFIGRLAQIAIIIFAAAIALRQVGIANEIISLAFGITLGAIALAAAISLGLGTTKISEREVDGFIAKLREPEEKSEE